MLQWDLLIHERINDLRREAAQGRLARVASRDRAFHFSRIVGEGLLRAGWRLIGSEQTRQKPCSTVRLGNGTRMTSCASA